MIARLGMVNSYFDLNPDWGYLSRGIQDRAEVRTKDGKLWTYIYYTKKTWELPLRFLPISIQTVVASWWTAASSLVFYPNYTDYPSSVWYVKISGNQEPLKTFERPYETYFQGALTLEQL